MALNFPDAPADLATFDTGKAGMQYSAPGWRNRSGMVLIRSVFSIVAGSLDGYEAYYLTIPIPSGFRGYKILLRDFSANADGAQMSLQHSMDGGASFAGSNYIFSGSRVSSQGPVHFSNAILGYSSMLPLTGGEGYYATYNRSLIEIDCWGSSGYMWEYNITSGYLAMPSTPVYGTTPCFAVLGACWQSGGVMSHIRIYHWDGARLVNGGSYNLFGYV